MSQRPKRCSESAKCEERSVGAELCAINVVGELHLGLEGGLISEGKRPTNQGSTVLDAVVFERGDVPNVLHCIWPVENDGRSYCVEQRGALALILFDCIFPHLMRFNG